MTIAPKNDEQALKGLRAQLGELQREIHTAGIPVIIVLEGLQAAGKSEIMDKLIRAMDPRCYRVHAIQGPSDTEKQKPFLWGFWDRLPPSGYVCIFDRSWYSRLLVGWADKKRKQPPLSSRKEMARLAQIVDFERQLTADGGSEQAKPYLLLKVFLDVDRDEQKRRLKLLEEKDTSVFLLDTPDWKAHKHFDEDREAMARMMDLTDVRHAPWHVVRSDDLEEATVRVFRVVVNALRRRLASDKRKAAATKKAGAAVARKSGYAPILDKVPTLVPMTEEEYQQQKKAALEELARLQLKAYQEGVSFVFAFEGMDAAGKGGCIKRLTDGFDPRGFEVVPIGIPDDPAKARHYLWRFWIHFPSKGHITIFDRSWYGRVLVERVEGLTPEKCWREAYDEINRTEKALYDNGTRVAKFWLHIDSSTEYQRFRDRETTPGKQWKIDANDWKDRSHWDDYMIAADEMLARTNTAWAPWTIVPADDKYHARITVLETAIKVMSESLSQ